MCPKIIVFLTLCCCTSNFTLFQMSVSYFNFTYCETIFIWKVSYSIPLFYAVGFVKMRWNLFKWQTHLQNCCIVTQSAVLGTIHIQRPTAHTEYYKQPHILHRCCLQYSCEKSHKKLFIFWVTISIKTL